MPETVTVTVEATWRMQRVEFVTPYSVTGIVTGYGEVLLQESTEGGGAQILRDPRMAETKTYGTMPAGMISRSIDAVKDETVEINDGTVIVTFATLMEAMESFLRKWRTEDQEIPMIEPMAPPAAVPLTPMPEMPEEQKRT